MRTLLHADGREVKVGDEVTSFRGEKAKVTGWPKDGWNRVWVEWLGDDENPAGQPGEYFPSVFDLRWKE